MGMRLFTGTVKRENGNTTAHKWEVHNKPPKDMAAFKELLTRPYGPKAELVTLVEKVDDVDHPVDVAAETTPPVPGSEE
jgi:hypothetical protein